VFSVTKSACPAELHLLLIHFLNTGSAP